MTSSVNPKTILLRGGDPVYVEARAAAAILPGRLIEITGPVRTVGAQPTAALAGAGSVSRTFARENQTIGNGITHAYEENDNVLGFVAKPGDQVYAWLNTAGNVAAGAALSAGANGTLVAATPFSQSGDSPFAVTAATPIIARSLQTINNTSGAPVRIKVEIV